jgi:Holliday junction resolvasome RuvABC DNA-binding subunit
MISVTILAFDALFVLLAVSFAVWSTRDKSARGVLSSVPSKSAEVRACVPEGSTSSPRSGQPEGVLVEVLVRMGFKPLQAQRAAAEIRDYCDEPLDTQVREALRVLCHGTGRVS